MRLVGFPCNFRGYADEFVIVPSTNFSVGWSLFGGFGGDACGAGGVLGVVVGLCGGVCLVG